MKIDRSYLTTGQEARLKQWESDGKPGIVCKLGYSIGSRGNNNFHSTWAWGNGVIECILGDSRNTWRKMVRKYGRNNVL